MRGTLNDVLHRAMQDESFLQRLKREPAGAISDGEYVISDKELAALESKNDHNVDEQVGLIKSDVLVAVAVTVVVSQK